ANISLDCAGHSITGTNASGTAGIYSDWPGTVVKNCHIRGFQYGVSFNRADNGTITGSTMDLTHSLGSGILFFNGANGNSITNVTAHSVNYHAILLEQNSSLNRIINSTGRVTGSCSYGIAVMSASSNNLILGSTGFSSNDAGIVLSSSSGNIVRDSAGISDTYRGMVLINSDSNTIANSVFRVKNPAKTECTPKTGYGNAIHLHLGSNANVFSNNTLVSPTGTLLLFHQDADGNVLWWNNFTNTSGKYVEDRGMGNRFSNPANGTSMGNIWFNVVNGSAGAIGCPGSVFPGLFYGERGRGVPYDSSSSFGKVSLGVRDYAPLTQEYGSFGFAFSLKMEFPFVEFRPTCRDGRIRLF
ncbi:MAG TPA: NosD domain-containing protein, partial [Candidatus Norongarragalinales archaeon]|nr:NosD domain-containing protein [Candidatus Norongarragalinales archaeon]